MKYLFVYIFCILSTSLYSQYEIDSLLQKYNDQTVPYISVQELKKDAHSYLILDTRKKKEFEISHIPNAIWGSEKVDLKNPAFAKAKKNQPIVVYCSVGIRSEDYGEHLKKLGYSNVKNLYGSIFAWKDAGYNLINSKGKRTDSVHVFSRKWGNYLNSGIKVY